jgi:NIMA (never in mitosis gene a)-related kinase
MAKTVIGTPYYMSPELFRNQPYSYKSDIWSLGCVLYELVGLKHAFEARDMNSLVQKILRANFAPIPSTASKDVRALIKSMLSLSPAARPSVNDVLAMPFIRKEMGSYIQNQLGDDSAAKLLKEDPKLLQFIQQEQDHLEQQARKLGFDIKKKASTDDMLEPPRPPHAAAPPHAGPARPSNLSMPNVQEQEQERKEVELREKERQKRAQAFLERELRAKERAEQALKQLQKEKQERLKALQAFIRYV